MRFVCPSASSSSLLTGCSTTSTAPARERPIHPMRRSARIQQIKESKVVQARKKKRIKIQYSRKPVPFTTVYIGNLLPGTRNEKVAELFRKIGPIEQTIVRCSGGLFVSRTVVPDKVLSNRDHHYATVKYLDPRSARRALALNGITLDGRKIVVSLSAADLPEAKLGLEMRLEETKGNQRVPEQLHRAQPVVRQDTEPCIDYSNNRHLVYGISFSKGIF